MPNYLYLDITLDLKALVYIYKQHLYISYLMNHHWVRVYTVQLNTYVSHWLRIITVEIILEP